MNIYNADGSLISIESIQNDPAYAPQQEYTIGKSVMKARNVIEGIRNGNVELAAYFIFKTQDLWQGNSPSMNEEDLKNKLTFSGGKYYWKDKEGERRALLPSTIMRVTGLEDYDVDLSKIPASSETDLGI
jgi:hypothetical protein